MRRRSVWRAPVLLCQALTLKPGVRELKLLAGGYHIFPGGLVRAAHLLNQPDLFILWPWLLRGLVPYAACSLDDEH